MLQMIQMVLAHICTGHRCLHVRYWFTFVLLTLLFCVLKVGETFSARWM